jgi:histidinol-phosphate aminotransferase
VRLDLSTNANPLGPNPEILAALTGLDIGPYPDPDYQVLRENLASFHGVHPDAIVVGAGASELIWRLVTAAPGPVALWAPTFGEYATAAEALDRPVLAATHAAGFLDALAKAALGFICVPNNPDGRMPEAGFMDEAQAVAEKEGSILVVDAAYAAFCRESPYLPHGATVLYAPNKVHGCTGIRAGYAVAPPKTASRLSDTAPSWVIGCHEVAFLNEAVRPASQTWLESTVPVLRGWRRQLGEALTDRGFKVNASPANYVTVDVGDAITAAGQLRDVGLKVRLGTSFGMPRHIRLSSQPPLATKLFLDELDELNTTALLKEIAQ